MHMNANLPDSLMFSKLTDLTAYYAELIKQYSYLKFLAIKRKLQYITLYSLHISVIVDSV